MHFVLTALVFFINRRNFGLQAASAAAAVMFTTVFSFDRLPDGYPMVITALLVYGGWMVWIEFCLVRANWDLAWIFAGLFASLIFYNDGVTGLLYFLIPIAMQRRPLTIWQKINRRGFYAGAGILAVTILFWFVPQENFPADPQKT